MKKVERELDQIIFLITYVGTCICVCCSCLYIRFKFKVSVWLNFKNNYKTSACLPILKIQSLRESSSKLAKVKQLTSWGGCYFNADNLISKPPLLLTSLSRLKRKKIDNCLCNSFSTCMALQFYWILKLQYLKISTIFFLSCKIPKNFCNLLLQFFFP